MNLQYISDGEGETTGVFIPIKEWNKLRKKYKGIEQEVDDIPEWHKNLVRERLSDYEKNPGLALDFDDSIDKIERGL
jgi:hypothetical protein